MPPHRHHPGLPLTVLVTVVVTAVATLMLTRYSGEAAHAAGQSPADGLAQVIPVPLNYGAGATGLALIDRENRTIAMYQYHPRRDPHKRLALLAVRSFRYDVQLEQFNTDQPLPHEVRELLRRAQEAEEPLPTEQSTKDNGEPRSASNPISTPTDDAGNGK